jgi:hypothetical protein
VAVQRRTTLVSIAAAGLLVVLKLGVGLAHQHGRRLNGTLRSERRLFGTSNSPSPATESSMSAQEPVSYADLRRIRQRTILEPRRRSRPKNRDLQALLQWAILGSKEQDGVIRHAVRRTSGSEII